MRTRYIAIFATTAMLLASCIKEPVEQQTGTGDGTATRITLSLKSDSRPTVGSRGAASRANPTALLAQNLLRSAAPGTRALTPAQEGMISNLHILIFDALGNIVANEHFNGLTFTDAGSVSLDSPPGAGMQVYAIANGDVNDDTGATLDQKLRSVTSIDQLKDVLVMIKGDGLSRTDRLLMVGSATATITKPHNTAIPIELHFLDAKVTLTVKDNTPAEHGITITGWDVVNIPKKSYLSERTGAQQADAVTGTQNADYITTTGKYPFETIDAVAKTCAHTIYLFENRRGARVARTDLDPANKYPGMSISDNDQRGKAYYAPPGATYMLIYGTYTFDGQMNNVVYKVFLGENPINDYNITRGKHYNYNVTINGLDNINIDTNVEWGSASFSVDHSDNFIMDAHPDFRVLRIGGTAVDGTTPAYATVEVLEADGTTPCTWLAVSPMNLYRHAIKQSGGTTQQFADGVGSFVRTKYTPTPTAESDFANATFAMTRKLTKIPFIQPAIYTYQNAIIYADAYNSTGDRAAKVRITYYKGATGTELAGQITYDITQSGPIKVSNDLYIERYEESAMLMHPGLAAGLQNTSTMQWGYNTAMLYAGEDRYSNGGYLTANAVYNNVQARSGMDAPLWTATDYAHYREKYPRSGAQVTEPSSLATTSAPYYYPELTSSTPISAYFHPIFNSSAARYCHEKNRDTDGDGVISAAETLWYLPSVADMWYITQNMPAGLSLTGTYWSSSEEANTTGWAFTFPAKTSAAAAKTAAYRVRCVRGTGAVLPDATIESTEADKTKINLASAAGANGAFDVADATGFTWTVASSNAAWLKIATAAAGTGAAASATGTANKTLYAYAATENTSTTDSRTATLTLTRPFFTAKTITVTQAKQPPLPSIVTPTTITLEFVSGASAAFAIDNKGTGLAWTVSVNAAAQSWLKIATSATGTAAEFTKTASTDSTLYAYAIATNTSKTTDRTATITFSRAQQADIDVQVTQKYATGYYPDPHTGWAGSNIYWEPEYVNTDGTKGRLTFSDVGDTSKEMYQGVYFKWGSLVAVSPITGPYDASRILFSPTGDKSYSWEQIPMILTTYTSGSTASAQIEQHDPLANIGDVCKYISERGWAPGSTSSNRWRVPTSAEMPTQAETTFQGYNNKVTITDANGNHLVEAHLASWNPVRLPVSPLWDTNIINWFADAQNVCFYQTSSGLSGGIPGSNGWAMGWFYLNGTGYYHANSEATSLYAIRCVRE